MAVIRRNDGEYGFRFYVGEVASGWLVRLRATEKHKLAARARLLTVPAIHVSLLWLAVRGSKGKDLFVRLDSDTVGRKQWMTRKDLDGLIHASIASASEMWEAARDELAQ